MSDKIFGKDDLSDLKTWFTDNKEAENVKSAAPLIASIIDSHERLIKNKRQQKLYLNDLNKTLGFIKSSEKGGYAGKHPFGV